MKFLIYLLLVTLPLTVQLQHTTETIINDSQKEKLMLFGILDQSLPVKIELNFIDEQVVGMISYGNSEPFQIEGDYAEEAPLVLYEFDAFHRVTGIITGSLESTPGFWEWSSADHGRSLPLLIHKEQTTDFQVDCYVHQKGYEEGGGIFVRSPFNQISLNTNRGSEMRWMEYQCDGVHCLEVRLNSVLTNPNEFVLSPEDEELLVYPESQYHHEESLQFENISGHGYNHFYSYNVPTLRDDNFNHWISNLVQQQLGRSGLIDSEEDETTMIPAQRMTKRAYGDFFLTLLSNHLVSGFLYFHGTHSAHVTTFPFTYDLNRRQFVRLNNLFEKEFDYPFFLKAYLERKGRVAMRKESRMIQELLKDESFSHMVLDHQGLVFFTNFHLIYGRRAIHLPFSEVESFIKHKTVSNFIKKNTK